MEVEILTAWSDNYIYVLHNGPGGSAAVVDPSMVAPVNNALAELGVTLTHVLITHYHADHIEGCPELRASHSCRVLGPPGEATPYVDSFVTDGESVDLGFTQLRVMGVPGHTENDLAFYSENGKALFTGDAMFVGGCGRVFGGSYVQMWDSLKKLRALPDDVRVYCGHDYSVENLEFAAHLDPANSDVTDALAEIRDKSRQGIPTVPSLLSTEKAVNPFLRCEDPAIISAAGVRGGTAEAVFAAIRKMKDRW